MNSSNKKRVRRKRQSQRQKLYNQQIPLDMAEARREIKSALKLHRAAASTKQNQIKQLPLPQLFFPILINPFYSHSVNFDIPYQNQYSYFRSPHNHSRAATNQELPKSFWGSEEEGKLIGSIGESGNHEIKDLEIDDQIQFGFDKAMEFPDWLSVNDDLLQHHNSSYHSAPLDYCLQEPHLSCLDIEEIEDVDGDWLA